MTLQAQILERQKLEELGSPAPDELILQQLGAAVFAVLARITNQSAGKNSGAIEGYNGLHADH
jgi:hypothetical protein